MVPPWDPRSPSHHRQSSPLSQSSPPHLSQSSPPIRDRIRDSIEPILTPMSVKYGPKWIRIGPRYWIRVGGELWLMRVKAASRNFPIGMDDTKESPMWVFYRDWPLSQTRGKLAARNVKNQGKRRILHESGREKSNSRPEVESTQFCKRNRSR